MYNTITWENSDDNTDEIYVYESSPGFHDCIVNGEFGVGYNAWGEPDFIDPDNDDLRIGPDSNCIDYAWDPKAPSKDILGHSRYDVPYEGLYDADIGAYEYVP